MKIAIVFGLGFICGAVGLIVYACCRLSGDLADRVEKWSNEE